MLSITFSNVVKKYKSTAVLDNISLSIPSNAVYGIVGPNGSGKTTLLNCLLGLTKPTHGEIYFDNKLKYDSVKHKIGVSLDAEGFFPGFSATENLELIQAITSNRNSVNDLLSLVGLEEVKQKKFKDFSLGMKQRLGIAAALITNPDIIILDEPTNGLDPLGIIFLRELIIKLNKQGKTVVIASHLLSEMERICSHFAIILEGKILFEGSKEKLLKGNTLEESFLNLMIK